MATFVRNVLAIQVMQLYANMCQHATRLTRRKRFVRISPMYAVVKSKQMPSVAFWPVKLRQGMARIIMASVASWDGRTQYAGKPFGGDLNPVPPIRSWDRSAEKSRPSPFQMRSRVMCGLPRSKGLPASVQMMTMLLKALTTLVCPGFRQSGANKLIATMLAVDPFCMATCRPFCSSSFWVLPTSASACEQGIWLVQGSYCPHAVAVCRRGHMKSHTFSLEHHDLARTGSHFCSPHFVSDRRSKISVPQNGLVKRSSFQQISTSDNIPGHAQDQLAFHESSRPSREGL